MKRKKVIKMFLVGVIIVGVVLGSQFRAITEEYCDNQSNKQKYNNLKKGVIWVTSDYDPDQISFSDFMEQKDSLQIEENTYQMLKNSDVCYYEENQQPLYYIGKYAKKDRAEHDYVNEEYDGLLLTECHGMFVDERISEDCGLKKKISKGRFFQNKEYQYDTTQIIPVIIGANYSDAFSIGDTFQGKFVTEETWKFRVVGVFEQSAELLLEQINLDDFILLPTLSEKHINDEREKKIFLSTKIEGTIFYKNTTEYQEMADVVNAIREKTGYRLTHIPSPKDYNGISEKQYQTANKKMKGSFGIVLGSMLVLIVMFVKEEFFGMRKKAV